MLTCRILHGRLIIVYIGADDLPHLSQSMEVYDVWGLRQGNGYRYPSREVGSQHLIASWYYLCGEKKMKRQRLIGIVANGLDY